MDDDVKNLFQKFGQPATAYQEISREVESEQAKKRWPLLRDVRVQSIPDHSLTESEDFTETLHSIPSLRQEAAAGVHHKPLFARDNGAAMPAVSHAPAKKKTVEPMAATTLGSPGIFRSESPQKTTPPRQEDRSHNEASSLFRSPKAKDVSAMHAQPEYQKNGAAPRSVHTDKHQPVSEVFRRLAHQPEPAKTAESPVNSFFKKIFKS